MITAGADDNWLAASLKTVHDTFEVAEKPAACMEWIGSRLEASRLERKVKDFRMDRFMNPAF
jgi:hypothetical protein